MDIVICFYLMVRAWWLCANIGNGTEHNPYDIKIMLLFIVVSLLKFWNWNYSKLVTSFYKNR